LVRDTYGREEEEEEEEKVYIVKTKPE